VSFLIWLKYRISAVLSLPMHLSLRSAGNHVLVTY